MYSLGNEFLATAEKLQEERNIDKSAFIQAICDAILAAYKKKLPSHVNAEGIKVVFDEETISIGIFAPLTVREKVENSLFEISKEEAKEFLEDIQEGEIVEADVTPENFSEYGRIAAQVARQIIKQRLNEEEKKLLFKEYEERKNKVVIAQISRIEERFDGSKDIILDLGRIEAVLPPKEQIHEYFYKKGARIRVFICGFEEINRKNCIVASHTHEELLVNLFTIEIPEIEEGIVEIVSKARIAGKRSKIAVRSNSDDIDPIGACIGARGARIQSIISELQTEKVDIIPWSDDPVELISYALSPTQIAEIALYDDNRALVIVPEDQLSLAIGKNGQNVKLASKLTGWKLDIRSENSAKK